MQWYWRTDRRSAKLILTFCIWLGLSLAPEAAPGGVGDSIMAASSGGHVWFLTEVQQPKKGVMIYHHAVDLGGAYYTDPPDVSLLSTLPQALAAWGSQLWMISYPEADRAGGASVRDVMTLRAQRYLNLEMYEFSPRARLELVAPLRGPGRLAGAVGTAQGPVVLFLPPQWSQAGVQTAGQDSDSESTLERARLMRLDSGEWVDVDLPEDFPVSHSRHLGWHLGWHLGCGGPEGREIWLVGSYPPRMGRVDVLRLDLSNRSDDPQTPGSWHRTSLEIDAPGGSIRSLTRLGSQVVAVLLVGESAAANLEIVRPTTMLQLHRMRVPDGTWAAVGVRDGVRIITEDRPNGRFMIRPVDAMTGRAGPAEALTLQPRGLEKILHVPILFAIGLVVLIAVVLIKPGGGFAAETPRRQDAKTPKRQDAEIQNSDDVGVSALSQLHSRGVGVSTAQPLSPLSPLLRVAALVVDFVPAAAVAMMVLDADVSDVVRMPLFALRIEDAMASALAIGLTIGHCLIGELIWSKSLGKSLVGGYVVVDAGHLSGDPKRDRSRLRAPDQRHCLGTPDLHQSRPGAGRILVRNVFKGLMLCIPPLALVVVLNPNWKGVGDILAGTIVVGPRGRRKRGSPES